LTGISLETRVWYFEFNAYFSAGTLYMYFNLLQINASLPDYKFPLLSFITAFVVAMILMPPLFKIINRFKWFDNPDFRKEHTTPIPTMGGLAACAGMGVACLFWFRFTRETFTITFFFSIAVLLAIGIMDDLKQMPANYKFALQLAVSLLIAFSGVRVTSFSGLFGINELPVLAQYTFTILAITGITNAFNLIDGIDGLAGGLGFMSLVLLGVFLIISNDSKSAIVAFSMAGGILAFLYYNFNPARIFMGDTGSLVLGFIISILSIRFIQLNTGIAHPLIRHTPLFALSIVFIPVFDTMRVFIIRLWFGRSPFVPDKNHIHHLLTNNGWSHSFTSKVICGLHAFILVTGYFLKEFNQLIGIATLIIIMLITVFIFQRMKIPGKLRSLEVEGVRG
jgi:UDP-GlcNAc:undecaprenyl-phosphate/decaprenyl-phosphate GlcNAc-1-phosphate transferase